MDVMQPEEIAQLIAENQHLKEYLESIKKKVAKPVFYNKVPREVRNESYPNFIYLTKGVVFIHIYRTQDMDEVEYHVIEPTVDDVLQEKLDLILKLIVKKAPEKKSVITDEDLREVLKEFIEEITVVDERTKKLAAPKKKGKPTMPEKVKVTSFQKSVLQYHIIKTLVGGGPLEAFMRDPYLEDIHFVANEKIHLIHKIFGMIKTNVMVGEKEAPIFARAISEKMGSPVSEGRPIVDGVLPDGSRGNIIYSSAISIKGPSMTIRRFT
ncbi:MAG: type II/IV secretion system ATPase subunit, partial [Candidatus Thermoplasmatota archaeon]|nr:type II/IV secretion system ATPase subunit [Candidatus Thermoplasmatota archaeon]